MPKHASRARKLSSEQLLELIVGQRWFASKAREPDRARVSGIHHAEGGLVLAIVEVRFPERTHETYALALGFVEGRPFDALGEAEMCRSLAQLAGVRTAGRVVRPMGVEQSNSSVVLDEAHVLKLYRRLEAGPNPELEVLRALGVRGFAHAPPLQGAIEHQGRPLDATLATVTGFVPSHGGGWELTLDSLSAHPEWLPDRARRLGEVTGLMHSVLAADEADPVFAPEEPSAEAMSLLVASVDEEIRRLFSNLPRLPGLEPIAGRGEDLCYLLRGLPQSVPSGLVLRIHGDYHLGQVLWSDRDDWVVIDFEGEPGRSLPERRQRQSALRDVAGMVRSFAYAADAAELLRGVKPPAGWAQACRERFLAGYRETVDPRLLPASEEGRERLLMLFELQKLLYELRYEVGNRPDWSSVPAVGLARLLERSP